MSGQPGGAGPEPGSWYRAINPNEHSYTPGYGFSPCSPAVMEQKVVHSYSCALGLALLVYFMMGALTPSLSLSFLQLLIRPGIFPSIQPLVEQLAAMMAAALSFLVPFSFYAAYIKIPRTSAVPQKAVPLRLLLPAIGISLAVSAVGFLCQRALLDLSMLFGFSYQIRELVFPAEPGAAAAFILNLTIVPAVLEETVFRGMILQSLRRFGDGFALVVSSLLFALVHILPPQMPNAFLMGLVIGYFVLFTGSARTGVAIHACNNALALLQDMAAQKFPVQTAAAVVNSFFLVYILLGLAALTLMLRSHSRLFALPLSTAINSAPRCFRIFFGSFPMAAAVLMVLMMAAGCLVAV